MSALLSPDAFQEETGVSRETRERLEAYVALLLKWNRKINLVSDRSLVDPWRRHMLDSAQLLPLLPRMENGHRRTLLDMGSGAGFPGMVLAILGAGDVHLVEADQRKTLFLREVAREVGSDAHIHGVRIEQMASFPVDVVTARALAPLPKLMEHAAPYLANGACGFFLKGKTVNDELTALSKEWKIPTERFPSRSNPSGTIVQVGVHGRGINGTGSC